MNDELNILAELFRIYFGQAPVTTELITGSGSQRQYYRLNSGSQSAIGTIGTDEKENKAFIEFAKHFKQKGLNVPEVFLHSEDLKYYIQEDFGDTDLLGILLNTRAEGKIPQPVLELYKKAITELVRLQIDGDGGLDYSLCFPRQEFDRTSIMWDLNYFKYYFLKMILPEIDEDALEKEFSELSDFLLSVDKKYFMYRDFQARNIIIKDDKPYFIDFQGGRKGPLQYDIASLLYQAKANISCEQKAQLLEFYISDLNKKINYPSNEFMQYYDGFVIIRILQTLGAYGFRGIIQQKQHFIQSIPNALANFQKISDNWTLPFDLKLIRGYIEKIAGHHC
ncbi:MAG: phosphotransferase [bacterium]